MHIAMNRNPLHVPRAVYQVEGDCIVCRVLLHNAMIGSLNKRVEALQCLGMWCVSLCLSHARGQHGNH